MTCNVGSPLTVIAVWVVAGLLSLAGALTYGEIASVLPRAGGDYVYIRDAYGRLAGFLYGWTRFFVANAGATASLAAGFAIFFNIVTGGALTAWSVTLPLVPWSPSISGLQAIALIAVAVVTLTNCAAVSVSGTLAVAFTTLKIVLVAGVAVVAAFFTAGSWDSFGLSA